MSMLTMMADVEGPRRMFSASDRNPSCCSVRAMNVEPSLKPMPPPDRLYVPGSQEFQEAIEKGLLHMSRQPPPPPPLLRPPSLARRGDGAPSPPPDGPVFCSSSSSFYDASDDPHGQFVVHESVYDSCPPAASADAASVVSPGTDASGDTGGQLEPSCLDEIIGHDEAKLRVQEVLLSLSPRFSAIMTGIRALPPSILLYGPPGCGKTRLARAIAGEARAAFLPVAPSDVMSKYVGESEGRMREIFSEAWNLAGHADSNTCVLFFDEVDALGHARGHGGGGGEASGGGSGGGGCSRRVIIELLLQLTLWSDQMKELRAVWTHRAAPSCDDAMDDDSLQNSGSDGPPNRIIVVAATNRFEDCDQALLRRFGIHLHLGLPSLRHRKTIVQSLLTDVSHALTPQDLQELAALTNGWSGSDLESLTREAAMAPVRECIRRANTVRKRLQSEAATLAAEGESHPIAFSVMDYVESDVEDLRPVVIQDFLHAMEFFSSAGTADGAVEGGQSDEDD